MGEYWYLVLLLIYFLVSVFYQAATAVRDRSLGGPSEVFSFVDSGQGHHYQLGINPPKVIPLQPLGEAGYPLSAWLWSEDASLAATTGVSPTWRVVFEIRSDQVIFTDAKGAEHPPRLWLTPAAQEGDAPREALYVSLRFATVQPATVTMTPTLWPPGASEPLRPEGGRTLQLDLEKRSEAKGRQIWDLLLGTPAITVASLLGVAYSIVRDYRGRRREQKRLFQERIQKLIDVPPVSLWGTFWDLWREVQTFPALRDLLKDNWEMVKRQYPEQPWLYQMRSWLSRCVRDEDDQQLGSMEALVEELAHVGVLSENEADVLNRFLILDVGMGETESEEPPGAILVEAFRILGLESAGLMVERAQALEADAEVLRGGWYVEGAAAGRYLLRRWGERESAIAAKLREWEREDPTPPRQLAGPCRLWQMDFPALSDNQRRALKHMALGKGPEGNKVDVYTPFGPLKAERDPRLLPRERDGAGEGPQALFWREHPVWEEMLADRRGVFVTPPGSGHTAFLRMAHHRRRFAGPEPAIHLHLRLRKPEDGARLRSLVGQALGHSLTCALVADPFWLLGADAVTRREVAGFLLHWAGGHEGLERALSVRGLSVSADKPYDARLLLELLYQFKPHDTGAWRDLLVVVGRAREALAEARSRAVEDVPLFLWVDVYDVGNAVLEEMAAWLWGHEDLFELGYLKLCLPHKVALRHTVLRWTPSQLQALLEHRAAQVGMIPEHWKHLYAYLEGRDPMKRLLRDAGETPAGLIRAGNALLECYGATLEQTVQGVKGEDERGGAGDHDAHT
ncbi:MAG: hypothetical protein ACP5HM_08225 [Anaerolineae bacterium]